MAFREITSLEADTVIALGKIDKKTGKPYPKVIEGYLLGSRTIKSPRGDSSLFIFETPKGNVGVYGTTDLNRKLANVAPGTMTRVTSTGTRPTKNGNMYTYKVEQDQDNVKDDFISAAPSAPSFEATTDEEDQEESTELSYGAFEEEDEAQEAALSAAAAKKKQTAQKLSELLARKK
jgi:hypothetical protein